MSNAKGRAWKMDRASVSVADKKRPRSNKYSGADAGRMPAPGERERIWVGGYVRGDGMKVNGYYRSAAQPR